MVSPEICIEYNVPPPRRVVWQGGWAGSLVVWGGWAYFSGSGPAMRLALARREAPAQPLPHVPRLVAARAVGKVNTTLLIYYIL